MEGLERLGLVSRADDADDRRRKTVSLTAAGSTTLAAAEEAGAHVLREIFGSLDPQQMKTMRSSLARLGTALTTE